MVFCRLIALVLAASAGGCAVDQHQMRKDLADLVAGSRKDHAELYGTSHGWSAMAASVAMAAPLANTNADEEIQSWYRENIRSSATDLVSDAAKGLGDGRYFIPLAVGAYLLGDPAGASQGRAVVGDWGERCMRSALLGAEPILVLQSGLGASRPGESDIHGSRWKPFDDSNGVSGHAFIGALPFVNAAMMTEDPVFKVTLYACSAVPAFARSNDDAHYFSQSLLGWGIAVIAADSVNRVKRGSERDFVVAPLVAPDGAGLAVILSR